MLTWKDWVIAFAIAAATLGIYADVRHHDFVNYDDPYYVTENVHVRAGLTWDGVRWAFTTFEDGNWFPLTWTSHMVDVSLWGLSPGAHHVTNAVLHVLSAALLFLLLCSMKGVRAPAALAAALFAMHPLRVESVAWAAERKDVLAGLLTIVTLAVYVGYTRRQSLLRYLAVIAAFACALMAKAMPVTLPFVMLLLDFWPLRRMQSHPAVALIREKTPLFLMSIAASVVAVLAQSDVGATATLASVPLGDRLGNAALSYVAYLRDTFWPASLAVFYPRVEPLPIALALGAVALLLMLTWFAWRRRAQHPYLIVGWLWFLGMLVPVIGLVQVGAQARADRYTYLPSIGLFIATSYTVCGIARLGRWYRAIWAVAAAAVVASAVATIDQIKVWRDSITLFEHAMRVTPPSYPVLDNLGEALTEAGDMARAAEIFDQAVKVAPGNPSAHMNLATALNKAGQPQRAIGEFGEAARLQPGNAAAYAGLGAVLGRVGRREDAVVALRESVRLDPNEFDPQHNLANVLLELGRAADATVPLAAAVNLKPDDARLRSNYGATLATLGRYDEAIAQFEQALKIDPSLNQTRANLDYARQLKARGKDR